MREPPPLARLLRSGVVESTHHGSIAVADADGRLVASAGDPEHATFARSTTKPLQAAVSLQHIPDDLPEAEIAVMCASHNAEPVHLEHVRALLARAGVGGEALRCPPALPMDPRSAREVAEPAAEYHDCSGKHAGMLLACERAGLDLDTYPEQDHPLQLRVLDAVAAAGRPPVAVGVDGCGVPVHVLALQGLATAYARLARPEWLGGLAGEAARAVAAMRAEPYLVAGRDRLCTVLMRAVEGLVVKVGAEGVVAAAAQEAGLGVAVKVQDGSGRARGPILLRVLRLLGVIDREVEERLAPEVAPRVLGGGRRVGSLEVVVSLA